MPRIDPTTTQTGSQISIQSAEEVLPTSKVFWVFPHQVDHCKEIRKISTATDILLKGEVINNPLLKLTNLKRIHPKLLQNVTLHIIEYCLQKELFADQQCHQETAFHWPYEGGACSICQEVFTLDIGRVKESYFFRWQHISGVLYTFPQGLPPAVSITLLTWPRLLSISISNAVWVFLRLRGKGRPPLICKELQDEQNSYIH